MSAIRSDVWSTFWNIDNRRAWASVRFDDEMKPSMYMTVWKNHPRLSRKKRLTTRWGEWKRRI
jgi:hypothetical protein